MSIIFLNFEPDSINSDELYAVWEQFLSGSMSALDFFDGCLVKAKDAPGHYVKIARYCYLKANAVDSRLAGKIPAALELEKWCDQIYQTLPQNLQW